MSFNNESRSKNAGRNIQVAIFNKLFTLLLVFVSRKIFIVYIGVEYLGINSLFSNVLTLLSMADLGLGTAMNVSLYKPIAEKDTRKLSALLRYYKKIYNYIAVSVAVIGCILLPFLKYIVNLDQGIPYIQLYYLVFLSNTVISYLFVYKSSIINADQNNYIVNKIAIFVNTIKVLLQIVVVILFKLYILYIILDVCGTFINNLLISRTVDKQYPFLKEKEYLSDNEKKQLTNNISSVFLYKISWCLINGTDNILMSILIGTTFVGYYTNYFTITSNIEAIIALIFTSLTAGIGNLIATEKAEQRFKTFASMQMVSYWLCAIAVCTSYLLIDDFIVLWLGKEYVLDKLITIAIVLNLYFSICMRPVWTFREGTGMYRQIRYVMLATAILNMVLSIILGRMIGLSGIIFATSISKILTYFWYEPAILYRSFFNKKPSTYFIGQLMNLFLMMICIFISRNLINSIPIDGGIGWVTKAGICTVVTTGIYYFRYYKTTEFNYIKSRVKTLFSGMMKR